MSIRRRIERLEEEARALKLDEDRCRSCRAPVPSMPPRILLFPEDIHRIGSPCGECGGIGGERAIPIDESGNPVERRPRLICVARVADDEVQPWKDDYVGRWLELNGQRSFGEPWDRWVRWKLATANPSKS